MQAFPPIAAISSGGSRNSITCWKGLPMRSMPSRVSASAAANSSASRTWKASSDEYAFTGLIHIGYRTPSGGSVSSRFTSPNRGVLVDHFLLPQPRPVLVLTRDDGVQARRPQAVPAAQDRHHRAGGKVPVADDRVDGAVEVGELPLGLVQQLTEGDLLAAHQFFLGQQAVEHAVVGAGDVPELVEVALVETE